MYLRGLQEAIFEKENQNTQKIWKYDHIYIYTHTHTPTPTPTHTTLPVIV
jgi:hypothetical protein